MIELLIAGPGTGKTTKIKTLLKEMVSVNNVLVISYTNATIDDLLANFKEESIPITDENCMTIHKLAYKINPEKGLYILNQEEEKILIKFATQVNIDFGQLCKFLQCETFDQMIENCINFIASNPLYVQDTLGTLELLIVDEYQDLNPNDRKLIELISSYSSDTLILGDDDQAIYDFRNASNEGILGLFERTDIQKIEYPNVCHRCPDKVVESCNNLISHNRKRIKKKMTSIGKSGDVIYKQIRSQDETIDWIIDQINTIRNETITNSDSIMILSNIEEPTMKLKSYLNENQIIYSDMWNKKMKLEIQKQLWEILSIYSQNNLIPMLCSSLTENSASKKNLLIKEFTQKILLTVDYNDLKQTIIPYLKKKICIAIQDHTNLKNYLKTNDFTDLQDALGENFLFDEANLSKVYLRLSEKVPFNKTGINIMSIHKSKGLSADHVFVLGLTEGILPNRIRGLDTLETQRRMLYVALSRARKNLFLVCTTDWTYNQMRKTDPRSFRYNKQTKVGTGYASSFLPELNNSSNIE